MATFLSNKLKPYNPKKIGTKTSGNPMHRAQGKLAPVAKKKNPYVRPKPGGGSGAVTTTSPSSPNRLGVNAQANALANRPQVSTDVEVNYDSDPTLAKIRALGQQSVGDAETEAAALRKTAVIDTGLFDVGQEIGLDEATISAARDNPLSLAARLTRESALRSEQLDESLNQQNLFYSGHRGTQLGNLGQDVLQERSDLGRDLRGVLGGIDSGVLDARTSAGLAEQEAMQEAAAAAAQAAQQQAWEDSITMALGVGDDPLGADPFSAAAEVPSFSLGEQTVPELGQQFASTPSAQANPGLDPYAYDNWLLEQALASGQNYY